MSAISVVNLALAVINALLALALGTVYWRNHRDMRSPFTLGLLLFAAFLLFHNAVFLYHTFTMMEVEDATAETFLLVEGLLQTSAVGALLVATMR